MLVELAKGVLTGVLSDVIAYLITRWLESFRK